MMAKNAPEPAAPAASSRTSGPATADGDEIARFARLAEAWWDPDGEFRALHQLNPVRAGYTRNHLAAHFGRDAAAEAPLAGLDIIDIGCGGGLMSEALARQGARVVAIDAEAQSIAIARAHAAGAGLAVDYRVAVPEALAAEGLSFDVVVTMEVIEHVADLPAFFQASRRLVRPDGALVVATLNRTLKSLALAKVGAEYLLRWVPVGTHDWRKFVKPSELAALMRQSGFALRDLTGFRYEPATERWSLDQDLDVNYVAFAVAA
jgi:2-polyprenyl-6-hydroxyphenyl methylase/3-demethylubiquinone-9 3-methyltransferase